MGVFGKIGLKSSKYASKKTGLVLKMGVLARVRARVIARVRAYARVFTRARTRA